MSKGILKYDLKDSSELLAFKRAISSTDAYLALYNVWERLRQTEKYGKEPISYAEFYEILADYDIKLGDLE